MSGMPLGVVIVVADSGPLLHACVEALLGPARTPNAATLDVVVVDNASHDGEPQALAAARVTDARLRVLRNASNRGFGPACNQGAAQAHGDALLFLNPDCRIDAAALAALRALAAAHPEAGVIGVHVRSPDGRSERAMRRRAPHLWRSLSSLTGLARFGARWPWLHGIESPPPGAATSFEPVDAVSGACLYVPRAVFDAVGGFDEGYFLHCEDLDLCARVREAGHCVGFAADIAAVHAQGSSSRRRPVFVAWHKHRGMWRYFRRHDPAARHWLLRALVATGIALHFALYLPLLIWRGWRARRGVSDRR